MKPVRISYDARASKLEFVNNICMEIVMAPQHHSTCTLTYVNFLGFTIWTTFGIISSGIVRGAPGINQLSLMRIR